MPLLVLHGWPASYVQFHPLIPHLVDPVAHGGTAGDLAFDVVNVSLPGFGFSGNPLRPGFAVRDMAERVHLLMTRVLGHSRYAVRGSDIGAVVQQQLSLLYPDAVIGNHTSGTLRGAPLPPRPELGPREQRHLAEADAWGANELAYANLHASKPQTLGNALNDSPAGLASWILEKFHGWGDTTRDVDTRFGRDALIDNLMVYWLGSSITPSVHFYYDFRRETGRALGRVERPTAVLMGMVDMVPPPRELVERQYRITRWTELPRGGHFLEWEEPHVTARDLREFFAELALD
jgi:pimeloyl-ACP methyl ester carboxylesterase